MVGLAVGDRATAPLDLRHLLLQLNHPLLAAPGGVDSDVELSAEARVLGLEPRQRVAASAEVAALGGELGLEERHDGDGLLEDLVLQQLGAEAGLPLPELLDEAGEVGDGGGARRRLGRPRRRARRLHLRGRAREVAREWPAAAALGPRPGRRRWRAGGPPAWGLRLPRRGQLQRRRRWRLARGGSGGGGGGGPGLGRGRAPLEAHGRLDAAGHHSCWLLAAASRAVEYEMDA